MFLERNYPWNLKLTTFELGVIRKLLRDDELTSDEEAEASRLSATLEEVYERLVTKKNEDLESSPPRDYVMGTQRDSNHRGPVRPQRSLPSRPMRGEHRETPTIPPRDAYDPFKS